nr:histone acetyltransferase HAC1-like [Tanacetum cinerariifolium]
NIFYYKDGDIDHPYNLTRHPTISEHDAQNKGAHHERVVHLRKMIDLLVYAYQCRSLHFQYLSFQKRLLYDNSSPRPPEEFVPENSNADDESFSPFPIRIEDINSFMEEIDLTFTPDDPMPSSIEEYDDDSRDILIREELLDNYSLPLSENESFHFDIPSFSRPPAKPPDGNTGILNIKMMGDVSDQKVPIPGLTITLVSN